MKVDEYNVDGWQGAEAQARAWLMRLKSGEATRRDLAALARWRASSADHERSYQSEVRMWQALGPALAPGPTRARTSASATPQRPLFGSVSRRWVLGGATGLAASAVAGIALVGINPAPAGAAVFETDKGERRHVRLAAGLDMEINTDSRLYFWADGTPRLTLDRGEAMITVAYGDHRQLVARANEVEITARQARFILRDDAGMTKIACLDGSVAVRAEGRDYALVKDRSLVLGGASVRPVEASANASETAWPNGLFVFKDRPAGEVVAELNRYRPGRVFLPGDRADVRITGVIHLDRVDLAVEHIARSLGMKVVNLPGGLALLRG